MGTTLTIRTGRSLREALERRAALQGKSVSAVVREILEEALAERPIGTRAGHLKGRLELPPVEDASGDDWRRQLRERNWRP